MIVCKYHIWVIIFLKLLFATIIAFSIYCLVKFPIKNEIWLCIPALIACAIGWIYIGYFKLEIGEVGIVQYGIKSQKAIGYTDVWRIAHRSGALIIVAKHGTIMISTDLTNRKEAISFVMEKLKPRMSEIDVVETKWWEELL